MGSNLGLLGELIVRYHNYVDESYEATLLGLYDVDRCFSYRMGEVVIFFSKDKWELFTLSEQFVFTIFLYIYRVYTYFSLLSHYKIVFTLYFVTILGFMLFVYLVLLLLCVYAIQNNKPVYEVSGYALDWAVMFLFLMWAIHLLSMLAFNWFFRPCLSDLLPHVQGPRFVCVSYYNYLSILPLFLIFAWGIIDLLKTIYVYRLEAISGVLLSRLVYKKKFLWFLLLLLILFMLFFFFLVIPILAFISLGPL